MRIRENGYLNRLGCFLLVCVVISCCIVICVVMGVLYAIDNTPPTGNYRISEDKSEEILYLFKNIALHRPSEKEKKDFELVEAHWLNKPTLITFTGDSIDKVLIDRVEAINVTGNKIIYGIARVHLTDKNDIFFVVNGSEILSFKSKKMMMDYLKAFKIFKTKFLLPEDYISYSVTADHPVGE